MKCNLLDQIWYMTKLVFYGTVIQFFMLSFLWADDINAQRKSIDDIYINIQLKNSSIKHALKVIEKETGLYFAYSDSAIDKDVKINYSSENASLRDVLKYISKNSNLHFKRVNETINISKKHSDEEVTEVLTVEAQEREVTGQVRNSDDGQGLPGVNVILKGTSQGTVTDLDGNFKFNVPDQNAVLVISYVGYVTQEIAVGNQSIINVVLVPDVTSLSEVVVTAFGIEREKKALGYSAQELEGEELTAAREVNVANYLTGKVAGVQVSNPSSGTGGSTTVTIRGNSSLTGNNQPLYVVDGIPIVNLGHSSGGLWGDNDYGDGIGNINPEDVESISVLKGPNASSLYGSRGANGVILITTKSGKGRKGIGVEFNSTTSIETLNQVPKTQNKYATGYEGTNLYGSLVEIDGTYYETMPTWHGDSWGPPLDGRRTVVDPFIYPGEDPRTLVLLPQDPNNVREFWETGVIANNLISFTGGTEKTSARLSIGNTYTKGITPNHSGNRNTINLRTTSKLTDRLSFDGKINYTYTAFKNRPNLGSSMDNLVYPLAIMGRYVPLDFLKEYYETTGDWGRWPGIRYNPYYVVNELKNHDERSRIIGYVSLKYDFTDWLSLQVRSGLDWYSDERQKIWPVGARGGSNRKGRLIEDMYKVSESNTDFLLTANGKLSNSFSGYLTFGGNLLKQYSNRMSWDARDFKAAGVYHISNAKDIRPSNYLWEKEMQSLYFMGQLAFKNYLFLDITGRNDWSSALGAGNYSYFYPSVSLSWVFTDGFEISSDFLTFGKLRASWAQVGNDSAPYMTKSGYTSYTTSYNGQGYASMSSTIPAFDLKNELTESWELGLDIRFFQNRLGFDLTYYNGNTKNQILPIQISNSSGYQRVVVNAGEIKNSGFEMTLDASIFRTKSGFNWDLVFNYAKNNSEVVELAPGIETYLLVDNYPNDIEARPGEAFGNIIGYKYKRSPDGQRIVGSGGNYSRESEKSILGNITPDWIGGLNNRLSFKDIFLSFLIDFVQGGELSSSTKYQMTAKGTGLFTEEGRRPRDTDDQGNQLPYVGVLDGVVEVLDGEGNVVGYEKNTQAVDGQTYWATRAWSEIGEEFVLDASYIMFRELMLGYNFKFSSTTIRGMRIALVGRNLFYLEEHMENMGISPESAPNTSAGASGIETLSMPTTRTFGININLTF